MTRKLALCLVIFSGGFTTLADHGNLRCGPNIGNMYYQFDLADGPETIRRHEPVLMPEITGENRDGIYTTHQSALKTVLAIRIASTIQDALQDFAKSNKELNERVVLAHRLSDAALELEQFAWDLAMTKGFGSEFFAPINGIRTLADNIKNYDPRPTFHGFSLSPFRVHPKLNVTAGGPQNAGHYNKLLFFGKVPEPGDFTMEGFLSEFDLSIDEATSDEYLLVKPVSAYDAYNKKLYVQLAMGTSVRSESFMRKPLNLTVVLDTSISMVADDNTGTSRLDWSKQMIDQIVNQLRKDDLFSLVIFDQEAQTLLDGANIGGSDIKTGYSSIAVGSVTNLFAGLKRGFDLASKHRQRDYENRVVLISDAGLNWGITDSTDLLRLVSD
ncbi:MAG TPA: VWA domain-containing protein, partial [Myxococcota bacterium]|nr:VWA domain-containing protein [Myxococcota bacterium]